MDKSSMNHAIRRRGSTAQACQVRKITSMHLGSYGNKRLGPDI
jgi:hypothetical protein